jgi:hypothetical protein
MTGSIPQQHPAVVLRSQYVHLRALLAIAMVAVVALAAAVVILAVSDNGNSSAGASSRQVIVPQQPTVNRYDGGPDEGTSGPFGVPRLDSQRYDGGPEEGTAGPGH